MGYALFFARKLSLTARVNGLNAQLMSISQQQMDLTNKISAKQNAANLRTAVANKNAASIYTNALKSGGDTQAAEATYNEAISSNDLQNAIDNVEINNLNQQQTVLDTQRKTLETQLNAAQNELSNVEKAEESAIKNSTAKYVG